ncbi:hypothetical protein [Actinophytocola sp. NPDC049390]|uniref:hypothetical protein n=1 Tax=Actinophytocola sp. NPDC049390 TaxID=3363894 RepID=UPI0037B5A0E5
MDSRFSTVAHAHAKAFDTGLASLPLPGLVDRMVRPMIEVNVANPGFKTIFTAADMPDHLAAPATRLHAAVAGRIAEVIRVRLPDLADDDLHRTAVVATQIFGSLLGTIVSATATDRERWVEELKRVLVGYLGALES